MNLESFEKGLSDIVGRPTNLRPFVCAGSPLDCTVFIVGFNPASNLSGDWWSFWEPNNGFMKESWHKNYLQERNTVSKTRRKIQEITVALGETRVLETNIESRPSKSKKSYPVPTTSAFDFVLRACRPKVVIAHGVDAVRHLRPLRSHFTLIESKHFIFVGHDRTAEIVAQAKAALLDDRTTGSPYFD